MWGQKWGALVGGISQPGSTLGPWLLVLGCLLGIAAVITLRSARKTGLLVSALILLIPLGALANFPHPRFLDGPIAHGYQVSDDLKELVPRVGEVSSGTLIPSFAIGTPVTILSSTTVVAPSFSDLQCVVTAVSVFRSGGTSNILFWQIAMRIGGTTTLEPGQIGLPGNPLPFDVVWLPDVYYSATSVAKFIIPAGQSASFGAKISNMGATISSASVSVRNVYNCTITPPPWPSGP